MLCDDLEGWVGERLGGRLKKQRIYVYLEWTHIVVQQKLTQYCKAVILQRKKRDTLKVKG